MDSDLLVDLDVGGRVVVSPTGDLDVATMGPLAEAMRRCEDGSEVVIDLTEVTFLDSSVLALLAESRRRCSVSVVGAQGIVRRVFEISGMLAVLTEA